MKNLKYIFLLFIAVFAFASCEDESAKITPPTADEILTRTWKLEKVTIHENSTMVQDVSSYNGFTLKLNANGTYSVSKVNDAFPLISGTWKWVNETTKRNIILDAGTEYEVELNVEKMEVDDFDFTMSREGGMVSGRVLVIPNRTFKFEFTSL